MEGFKRGFYTTSKKLERKPDSNLGQSSFPQPQLSSQSQQPGEEQKQVQKIVHATTPTSQEKPRKQMKSALNQAVSEFNPSSQMSMEQLFKVVLNLQEEVRKLKKDNDKLMKNLNNQEEIESRFMFRKEIEMLSEAFHKIKATNLKARFRRNTEIGNRIEKIEENQQKLQLQMEIRKRKSDPMQIEQEIIRKPQKKQKQIKIIKKCFCYGSL